MPGALSPTLAEGVTRLAAWMPFARAAEQVAFFWQAPPSAARILPSSDGMGSWRVATEVTGICTLPSPAAPRTRTSTL